MMYRIYGKECLIVAIKLFFSRITKETLFPQLEEVFQIARKNLLLTTQLVLVAMLLPQLLRSIKPKKILSYLKHPDFSGVFYFY
jgi:hypothetical protein